MSHYVWWGRQPTFLKCHWNDIQHGDFDTLLSQKFDHMATNTSSTTSDDDDLLVAPVILVRLAIVQGPVREPIIDEAGDTQEEQGAHAGEGRVVQDGKVLAASSETCCEQNSAGEDWVEGDVAEKLDEEIALEPLAGNEAVVHGHLADFVSTTCQRGMEA